MMTRIVRLLAGPQALTAAVCLAVASSAGGCRKKNAEGARQMPDVQVVVVEAKRRPVIDRLPGVVGTIAANEIVEVKSETDGIVQVILFEEGQPAKQGELLVRLDNSKLNAALAEAEANFDLSQANLKRSEELLKDQLISQQEFDQVASSFSLHKATVDLRKRQLKDTTIRAPFKGVAGVRMVSPGQVITRNSTLTWLVDLDPVKVEFNVPERFLSRVEPGQSVDITVAAYPDRTFEGKVYFVSPYVEESTRRFLVKAKIPNPTGELKPGMFARLELTLTVRENSVVIPEAAVHQMLEESGATVYIVDAEQTVRLRTIRLGLFMPGQVEVLEGLDGGEQVIVEGVQKVGPGSKVKLAPPEAALPYERVNERDRRKGAKD